MLLKAPQVRLEQAKCSFGIPRIDARSPQTDYAAFLLLYDAPPFGDELLGAAKIVFGTHLSNNTQTAKQAQDQEIRRLPPPWTVEEDGWNSHVIWAVSLSHPAGKTQIWPRNLLSP